MSGRPAKGTGNRDACDKCHSLKTRCQRNSNESQCERCIRFHLNCTFSPAKPHGRPKGRRSVKSKRPAGQASAEGQSTPKHIQHDFSGASSSSETLTTSSPAQSCIEHPLCQPEKPSPAPPLHYSISTLDEWPALNQNDLSSTGEESSLPFCEPWILPLTPGASVDIENWMSYKDCTAMLDMPDSTEEHVCPTNVIASVRTSSDQITMQAGVDHATDCRDLETSEWLHSIMVLQLEILILHRSLRKEYQQSDASGNSARSELDLSNTIETTYSTTQTLVSLTEELSQSHAEPAQATRLERNVRRPHFSSTLLLFSCYTRMMSVYELLVRRLTKLCKDQTLLSPEVVGETSNVPAFCMGHSRLSMPPAATLGMHVVAINSMVEILTNSLGPCVERDSLTLPGVSDARVASLRRGLSRSLAGMADVEVEKCESALSQSLQQAKSIAGL